MDYLPKLTSTMILLIALQSSPQLVFAVRRSTDQLSCLKNSLLAKSADSNTSPDYPETTQDVVRLMDKIQKTVYEPALDQMGPPESVSAPDRDTLWRMGKKIEWRKADRSVVGSEPERRIKMLTNQERRAHQSGGLDESADPSPPFEIHEADSRPVGMPAGSFSLSSGKSGFIYPSTNDMLRNGKATRFEIEFQQITKDGRVVTQTGGYAAPDSSWGWDGRLEYQPNKKGGYDLVITQGAMELPSNYRNAEPGSPDLPGVGTHNESRTRHVFKLIKWLSATAKNPAKLVVRDEGSILEMKPSAGGHWLEVDENGKLLHAHGYGENFVPDPKDPRKMLIDEDGYTWRIFDMVTREMTVIKPNGGHKIVPLETRAVAYRMDPNNPSKVVPAGVKLPNGREANEPVFVTSNHLPGSEKILPATIRYLYDTHGTAIEERSLDPSGKIVVKNSDIEQGQPAVLNEGLNLASEPVKIGNKNYLIGTNSAGEYTSGGIPKEGIETHYGAYLWWRGVDEKGMGPFHPVLNSDGTNLQNFLAEATQMYGLSWGIGRPQLVLENGQWWIKAHGVDVDLLPKTHPHHGYPPSAKQFSDDYRRSQLLIPVKFVEKNGAPAIEIDDPQFEKDVRDWRQRRSAQIEPFSN